MSRVKLAVVSDWQDLAVSEPSTAASIQISKVAGQVRLRCAGVVTAPSTRIVGLPANLRPPADRSFPILAADNTLVVCTVYASGGVWAVPYGTLKDFEISWTV